MNSKLTQLSIVIPCYNEEEVLNETISRLTTILNDLILKNKISQNSYILFVDDGSSDNTWNIIKENSNKNILGLKLSLNKGHQNALIAGMNYVQERCDCLISIDADLQDDINIIGKMIDEYLIGNEIVYAARSKRENDSFFKKQTAQIFYKTMKYLGVNLVFNHADFRLMSKKAIRFFNNFSESNLFIRGIVPLIGLKSSIIYYERQIRFAGETKYPLKKMITFAIDGITSLSVTPLRIISVFGFFVFIISFFMAIYIFFIALFTEKALPGWASTVLPIYFLGGVQILSIGVVGEYIGKIYTETKRRPKYFIEEELNNNEKS